jgi:hypothetical protein
LIPTSILLILLRAILFLSTSSPKISSFEYAMAATSSSTQSSGNTEKWLEYNNNTYGISIQYPSSWESSPGENNGSGGSSIDVATFSPTREKNSSAILDLLVDTVDPGQNLKQYVSDSISDNMADRKDFRVLKSSIGNITLAGVPAYKIVYTYADAGQNFKGLETGTIIGNRVYFVQYENSPSRYDKDISTAQKMIDSFKIENPLNVINR